MIDLLLYGWNEDLFQQKQVSTYRDVVHGRISITHKTRYEVVTEQGFLSCELSGNMLYGRENADYPCTGDWVLLQQTDSDKGIILDLLPRRKTLYRLRTGSVSEKQAIASHVDKGFIVQSVDSGFSVRRIERFVLQLSDEDIQAILILTKTDLDFDKQAIEAELKHLAKKIPIFYTSTEFPDTIAQLKEHIGVGDTVLFTGISGVGKSTLINAFCGKALFETNSISSATGKGKHTTTRREMVLMPDAGVLIDTPGVKVFGVTNDDTNALSEMLDIADLEGNCKFIDCQHINEKGCAVIQAVEDGEIDAGVYQNYIKMRKEAWHFSASVAEKRKTEKSFSKMVKEVKKNTYKKHR